MFPLRSNWLRWTILLVVALLCVFVFRFCGQSRSGLEQWIPAQTALVVEVGAFKQLIAKDNDHGNTAWRTFFESSLAQQFKADGALLLKVAQSSPTFAALIFQAKTLLAFSLQSADAQHGLFVMQLSHAPALAQVLAQGKLRNFPTQFKGYTIYSVYGEKNEQIVLGQVKDYLICAHFSYLVEDALTQYDAQSNWWAHRKYAKELPSQAPWKFYIRPSVLSAPTAAILQKTWVALPEMLARNIQWIGISWDGDQTQSVAEGTGFLRNMDRWGQGTAGKMAAVIPDHAACWALLNVEQRSVFWDQFAHGADPAFRRYILPWVGSELAYVLTEPLSPGMLEDQFWVFATQDQEKVVASLKAYGAERGTLKVEHYQMFEVYTFLDQAVLVPLTGASLSFRNPVCAVVGNYVVFAGSRSAMEVWLDKYIVNQTLVNYTGFLQLYAGMQGASNGMLYLNTGYANALMHQLLADPGLDTNHIENLTQTGLLGIQGFAGGNGRIDFKMDVQAGKKSQDESGILWKTPLSAPALTPPYICSAQGTDPKILLQDTQFELYCLAMNGATSWRRQLSAPILSAVHAVDFFDNGRICYLFNTADAIWLLDEKGQTVDGFPIRLQSPASNGLCLVDFDGNKHFSLFLACKNGNIYGFDQYGRPISGWNPQAGNGKITHPILHFQQGNQDYLAALSTTGKLSVFGRSGALHFPVTTLDGTFSSAPQLSAAGSDATRIVSYNTSGVVFKIGLKGNVQRVPSGAQVVVANAQSKNLAMLRGRSLRLGNDEKGYATQALPTALDTLFFLDNQCFGGWTQKTSQIYLLDRKGRPFDHFPLAGTTPFEVFEQHKNALLITGNGASVYAYKLGNMTF
jgi:hypothetical protein